MSSKLEFENWNSKKIIIHDNNKNMWTSPRDIWWCILGKNIGTEEDGKGEQFFRPAIVIKTFGQRTCLAVPLTTSLKDNPFHFKIGLVDGKTSFAILSQVRCIDTKRLYSKIGKVDKDIFLELKKAITDTW